MKITDNRYDERLLKSFIGKKMNKIKHDHFSYTNTVTGIVGFMIDNKSYALINDFEPVDYLDWDNEACICRIVEKPWDDISSYVEEEKQITTIIDEVIKSITIVNDHIESYSGKEKEYDWWETRAIIFDLGSYQIAFTKQVCFFSMEIEINKGYNLIDKIEQTDKFYNENKSSEEHSLYISREIVEIV